MARNTLCAKIVAAIATLAPWAGNTAPLHAFPEPSPPTIVPHPEPRARLGAPARAFTSTTALTEWTRHKSPDGSVPGAGEQKMLWLLNRARSNPTQEGIWLAAHEDPDIASGRTQFAVDLDLLKQAFAAQAVRAPAAFDFRLHQASLEHSLDLIARDTQDHLGQADKIAASGFTCNGGVISTFATARSALYAHAALNIDWGSGANTVGGMQEPPGHRNAIMGEHYRYDSAGDLIERVELSNVGLALAPVDDPTKMNVGPLVFSGAYCRASEVSGDHNRLLVGTVWKDLDGDQEYDEGEGLGEVTVMPDRGDYFAKTGQAGGFALPVTSPGEISVQFSGGELAPQRHVQELIVGDRSVAVDLNTAIAHPDSNDADILPLLFQLLDE